jgi:hypothetical protein
MKQENHRTGDLIDSTQVRSFQQVALLATPGKVLSVIASTVLARDDMIEMEA